ncbi:MAG: hypothetical protein ACPG4T_11270 [Nannocystaceae bacterium]
MTAVLTGIALIGMPGQVSARSIAPAAMLAPEGPVSADEAAKARADARERGQSFISSDEPGQAAEMFEQWAYDKGDPLLFIDAAEAHKMQGERDRDIEAVERGIEMARISLDILYFLQGDRANPKWAVIPVSDVTPGIRRAEDLIDASEALIEEIKEENTETEPEPEPEPEDKPEGTGLIIAGSALTAVGLAGAGLGAFGAAKGSSVQKKVNMPDVYGAEFDDLDAEGKKANIFAFVGLGLAVVGLAAGTTLLVLGVKKRKKSKQSDDVAFSVAPSWGGMSVSGRF